MKLLLIFVTSAVLLQYHFAATAPGQGQNEAESSKQQHKIQTVGSSSKAPHDQTAALSSLLAALKIQNLPKELNNYRIIKKINAGSYGTVAFATHIPTDETVAIKIIDKIKLKHKSDGIEMLKNEVKVMKLLNHPNIVKLFHAVETDDKLYLVIEYASDGDVYEYLTGHGKFSEEVARAYFREIVSSVEYLHRKNIAHRDLKPDNFLLDDNLNTKVADFGFSLICPDSELSELYGTPHYMSPELIQGAYDGLKNDAWSLGVILYQLMTGSPPFEHTNTLSLFKLIRTGKYNISPVPVGCRDLITNLLKMDSTKRPTSKEIMEHPWMNIGYENNILKQYTEPKLDSIHQNEIKEVLIKKGYKEEDIEAAIENKNYDDHVYAAYLILERKRINAGLINAGGPVGAQGIVKAEQLNKYVLTGEVIGKVGFARVKLAKHKLSGEKVAIKIIDKTHLDMRMKRRFLEEEVKNMKKLNHPNVVILLQEFETITTKYLVMEYPSGGYLSDYLKEEVKLSEVEARTKFRQLVSAIEYLHRNNIYLSDLKPDNLLLDSSKKDIMISNFLFSHISKSDSEPNKDSDSLYYMAPETQSYYNYDRSEAIVWTLGIILYKFVTGSLPFHGKKANVHILLANYNIPNYVPTDLKDLIGKLIVADPNLRPNLEQIMKHKWMHDGNKNNNLIPYVEPKLNLNDQNRINALEVMGYTKEEIKASLTKGSEYGNDVYAAYLIVGKRITNLGPNHLTLLINKLKFF